MKERLVLGMRLEQGSSKASFFYLSVSLSSSFFWYISFLFCFLSLSSV